MTLDDTITRLQANNDTDSSRYATLLAMQKARAQDVPFVVVAMNRQEAQDFFDGNEAVFDSRRNVRVTEEQTVRFQAFKQAFHDRVPISEREAWCQQYRDARDEWMPDAFPHGIKEHIETEALEMFTRLAPPDGSAVHAYRRRFFWPDFQPGKRGLFDNDGGVRLQAWRRLHCHYNSVLVIDGISLFHPFIRDVLKASPLDWRNAYTGVVILFPMRHPLREAHDYLEREIRAEMSVAFVRFDEDAHSLFALNVGAERDLKRWLGREIAGLMTERTSPDPDNLGQVEARRQGQGAALLRGGLQ